MCCFWGLYITQTARVPDFSTSLSEQRMEALRTKRSQWQGSTGLFPAKASHLASPNLATKELRCCTGELRATTIVAPKMMETIMFPQFLFFYFTGIRQLLAIGYRFLGRKSSGPSFSRDASASEILAVGSTGSCDIYDSPRKRSITTSGEGLWKWYSKAKMLGTAANLEVWSIRLYVVIPKARHPRWCQEPCVLPESKAFSISASTGRCELKSATTRPREGKKRWARK